MVFKLKIINACRRFTDRITDFKSLSALYKDVSVYAGINKFIFTSIVFPKDSDLLLPPPSFQHNIRIFYRYRSKDNRIFYKYQAYVHRDPYPPLFLHLTRRYTLLYFPPILFLWHPLKGICKVRSYRRSFFYCRYGDY